MARSERFKIAFTRFREKDQDEIFVPDHNYPTFLALLKYLYTDNIEEPDMWELENLMDLLVCAEEYQVNRLKSICEVLISQKIKNENCLDILQLADMHFARDLKKFTLKYINEHIIELESTGELLKLNMNLMAEIIQYREATELENEEIPTTTTTDQEIKSPSTEIDEQTIALLSNFTPLPPWPSVDENSPTKEDSEYTKL